MTAKPSLQNLEQAILFYNESFLAIREINLNFSKDVLKIPEQAEVKKIRLEKSKPLLEKIKNIKSEMEETGQIPVREDYYDFEKKLAPINLLAPPSVMDGYLMEAMREYFVETLDIKESHSSLFKDTDNQYFDFCLEHMVSDASLIDSMEIIHMRHWALIGKALARKKIDELTKKRGAPKKAKVDEKTSYLDIKRARFVDGVLSELYEMELEGEIDDCHGITDEEAFKCYVSLFKSLRSKGDKTLEILEKHIQLINMDATGAKNSFSRGRAHHHYISS